MFYKSKKISTKDYTPPLSSGYGISLRSDTSPAIDIVVCDCNSSPGMYVAGKTQYRSIYINVKGKSTLNIQPLTGTGSLRVSNLSGIAADGTSTVIFSGTKSLPVGNSYTADISSYDWISMTILRLQSIDSYALYVE